jgi:hypothetical protein
MRTRKMTREKDTTIKKRLQKMRDDEDEENDEGGQGG